MADKKEKLFSEFPPTTTEEWMAKIQVDLKGADFEKKLVWKTNEGFKTKPFYRMEDIKDLKTIESLPGKFPYLRGTKKDCNTWLIRQDIVVEDAQKANVKALDILNRGIDSIGFKINGKDISTELIETLLKDICAECVELNFITCPTKVVTLAQILVNYYKEKEYDLSKLVGSIEYDHFNIMLLKGKEKDDFVQTCKQLMDVTAELPKYRIFTVHGITLTNAGAYIYQELGYALAWGNEYLNQLTDAGLPAAAVAKKIKFIFGISSNYFMEIAKFRAARMLWANIVASYRPECHGDCPNKGDNNECRCSAKMKIHAVTSQYNQTIYDSYVNLLRSQTEAMSAVLAGIDSMTVTPFDEPYEKSDDFSERLARNQQLLLKEESHFDKVVDPAGGSYYIEVLTASIANEAWKLFLSVSDEGGIDAAIRTGKMQEIINASDKARHEAFAKRRETLVGTNQFPNFNEKAGDKILSVTSHCTCEKEETTIPKLKTRRLADEFETLRFATEKSSHRPKVFMLTIGNLAMRQARAQFSCNFFACAGYEVIDNLGFETVEKGVKAAVNAKADIIVLCSSDDEYAEYAIPAFKTVNNRALFVVAGAPACMEDLKAAGIKDFIHVRVNVLETLKEFNTKLLK